MFLDTILAMGSRCRFLIAFAPVLFLLLDSRSPVTQNCSPRDTLVITDPKIVSVCNYGIRPGQVKVVEKNASGAICARREPLCARNEQTPCFDEA
jgi:hypothetical protein